MDTIYKERANGRWEFFTYSDGKRIVVSEAFAHREQRRKLARIIELQTPERKDHG